MEFTVKNFEGAWIIQTEGKMPRDRKAREIIKKYTESSLKRNQLRNYRSQEEAQQAVNQMKQELGL